jgi:hypothetical protein
MNDKQAKCKSLTMGIIGGVLGIVWMLSSILLIATDNFDWFFPLIFFGGILIIIIMFVVDNVLELYYINKN